MAPGRALGALFHITKGCFRTHFPTVEKTEAGGALSFLVGGLLKNYTCKTPSYKTGELIPTPPFKVPLPRIEQMNVIEVAVLGAGD